MKYTEFMDACTNGTLPQEASDLLQSLYEDKRGDWDTAHSIAQTIHTRDGSLVHAYLHREEGDIGNSNYWYARAESSAPDATLEEEWETLARRYTDG